MHVCHKIGSFHVIKWNPTFQNISYDLTNRNMETYRILKEALRSGIIFKGVLKSLNVLPSIHNITKTKVNPSYV